MKKDVKTEELSFFGADPGAVKFGNFINYYSFHNVQERTSKLHPQMFPKVSSGNIILCLDVGCNTGDLTKELYKYLATIYIDQEIYILGIDIDPKLIERAQESNDNQKIIYKTVNIMEENEVIDKYLSLYNQEKFDITFCFSVSMWIHLNNGDQGLLDFLRFIQKLSKAIIIEPQPWNCYRSAQRRLKKSGSTFQQYDKLRIRSNVGYIIENKLQENNFKKMYETSESSWSRKIYSYHCNYK